MRPEAEGRTLAELADREAIRDCLYGYCRAIDRADEAALRRVYWPDATDRHGATSGPVEVFFARAAASFRTETRNVHQVGNILIAFRDPDRAAVESYFNAFQRGPGADGAVRQFHLAGRYCDLFEKRGDEWRVAERVVVYDWVDEQPVPEGDEAARFGVRRPIGSRWPDDPVYAIGATAPPAGGRP